MMTAIPLIRSPLLTALPDLDHGFTTRAGGVSRGIYQSLNLSPYSGDSADRIVANRQRVCTALAATALVTLRQVHSTVVHYIGDANEARDAAAMDTDGDGIVTTQPGIAIGALGADCAPVLFADPVHRVIGVAHGGWKGAVGGIAETVINAMTAAGADLTAIRCAIGPAIQPYSYAVDADFVARVKAESPLCPQPFFSRNPADRWHFDLPGYIESRVKTAGIRHVERLALDTCSDPARFFSYRRACHQNQNEYGRQGGFIVIRF